MADSLRFYLDENVDPAIADGLRNRGVDVVAAAEAERLGLSDEEQLEFALREGRVLVTHDRDFLRLHSNEAAHAGIVYAETGSRTVGEMIRFLKLVYDVLLPEDMRGHVEFA